MSTFTDLEKDAASVDGFANENGLIPTRRNGPKPSWQYLVDGWNSEFDTLISDFDTQVDNAITSINADVVTVEAAKNTAVNNINADVTAVDTAKNSALDYIDDATAEVTVKVNNFNDVADTAISDFEDESQAAIIEMQKSRGFRVVGEFADGFTYELFNDVGIDADGNSWIYVGAGAPNKVVPAGTVPSVSAGYEQVTFNAASNIQSNTGTVQGFIDSFELKVFQSPTTSNTTLIESYTKQPNQVFEVRKTSDDTFATIYSDAAGTTEIVQNGTDNKSGSDGVVEFYIVAGEYYVKVEGTENKFNVQTSQNSTVNIQDFGLMVTDGDWTSAFNAASEKARDENKYLVLTGDILLQGVAFIYTNCDSKLANIILDGGRVEVLDSRQDYSITYTDADLNVSNITNLKSSFNDVISAAIDYSEWVGATYIIKSPDTYIYRNNNGTWVSQPKYSIGKMDEAGRLQHTVSMDFSSSSGVTIELVKKNDRFITIDSPHFTVLQLPSGFASGFQVSRSNTKVNGLSWNLDNSFNKIADANIFKAAASDVIVNRVSGDSIGSFTPQFIAYDLLFDGGVDIEFSNVSSSGGWKTIDGNRCRGVTIKDSTIGSVNGHYACSDITVENTHITYRPPAFAIGADDSTILMKNIKYTGSFPSLFSVRTDYGELRGDVILKDINISVKDSIPSDGEFVLAYMQENTINGSVAAGYTQPNIYSLPNIYIDGVTIKSNGRCHYIKLAEQVDYGVNERLNLPEKIKIINVDYSGCELGAELRFAVQPYNYPDCKPVKITLNGCNGNDDQATNLNMRHPNTANPYDMKWVLNINNSQFSTFMNGEFYYTAGDKDSELYAENTKILKGIDSFSGGVADWIGTCQLDNVTILFTDEVTRAATNIGGRLTKVSNCIIDGSEYLSIEGSKPDITNTVTISTGNIAINAFSSSIYSPDSKRRASDGRQAIINGDGEHGVFNRDDSTGTITPTFDPNISYTRSGSYYVWWDFSGNQRAKDGLPASITDGTVISTI